MSNEREYPEVICGDCGHDHGRADPTCATWYPGQCDVCGAVTYVTEPRDFGHLEDSWKHTYGEERIVIKEGYPVEPLKEYILRMDKGHLLDGIVTHTNIREIDHNPYDGIKVSDFQPKNIIQIMNDQLSKNNGFAVDPASVFRMVPEVGELVDAVLKVEGLKKIKSTDSIENQMEEVRDGIGDVLVLLAQVASHYNIDIEEAYMETWSEVSRRSYHN